MNQNSFTFPVRQADVRPASLVSVSCFRCTAVLRRFCVLGYIYRNCTENGWSEIHPPYDEACEFSDYEKIEPEVEEPDVNVLSSHGDNICGILKLCT